MDRQIKSRQELSDLMTQAIQRIEDFDKTEIACRYRLAELDDGCNWSADVLIMNGPGTPDFHTAVAKIVAEHRRIYNLPSEDV